MLLFYIIIIGYLNLYIYCLLIANLHFGLCSRRRFPRSRFVNGNIISAQQLSVRVAWLLHLPATALVRAFGGAVGGRTCSYWRQTNRCVQIVESKQRISPLPLSTLNTVRCRMVVWWGKALVRTPVTIFASWRRHGTWSGQRQLLTAVATLFVFSREMIAQSLVLINAHQHYQYMCTRQTIIIIMIIIIMNTTCTLCKYIQSASIITIIFNCTPTKVQ